MGTDFHAHSDGHTSEARPAEQTTKAEDARLPVHWTIIGLRWASLLFTSYPGALQNEALRCLDALRSGPLPIIDLQNAMFSHATTSGQMLARRHKVDAQQAFEQLAQLGAIVGTKQRRSDGAWAAVALTPIGVAILDKPDEWFDAGHLRRAPRRRG